MKEKDKEVIEDIALCAQLAAILEVTAPKPGNVSPENGFSDTTHEDFLVGSLALGKGIKESARRGILAGREEISPEEIKIGELIKECMKDVSSLHEGGNTHLGMVMLMVPLASALGMSLSNSRKVRENLEKIVEKSTVEDSLNFYQAVKIAPAGGLKEKLREPEINFYQLMKDSAEKDRIAEELTQGLKITFQASQNLEKNYKKARDRRGAIVQSYLELLAKVPDTLVMKKKGEEEAKKISERAEEVVNSGGIFTKEGKKALQEFNSYLQGEDNKLNPGTTADIVATGTMLWLLREKFNYKQK